MNVIELMAVPAIEKPTAQPGMARPPTKYPSVVWLCRRTAQAIQAMPPKYAAITSQSRTGIEVTSGILCERPATMPVFPGGDDVERLESPALPLRGGRRPAAPAT